MLRCNCGPGAGSNDVTRAEYDCFCGVGISLARQNPQQCYYYLSCAPMICVLIQETRPPDRQWDESSCNWCARSHPRVMPLSLQPSRRAACRPHPRCPHHHHRCHRGAGGKPGNDPARYRDRAPRRRRASVLGGQQHPSRFRDCARYAGLARRAG